MKKLILSLLAAVGALCCAFGLAACGDPNPDSGNTPGGTEGHTHRLAFVAEKSATCTKEGNLAYYACGDCGKWFYDGNGNEEIFNRESVMIMPRHGNISLVGANPATCTAEGNREYYTCGDCGKWFYDAEGHGEIFNKADVVIPVDGHNLNFVEAKPVSCTEDGNHEYFTCMVCEKWFGDFEGNNEITDKSSVIIPSDGHAMTPVAATPASCTEGGNSAYYICGECGLWYSDEDGKNVIMDWASVNIPAEGHAMTSVAATPATCTEDGNSEYYICGKCDKWFQDEDGHIETSQDSVVLPKGHNMSYVDQQASTCTEDGHSFYFTCDVCEKWFSDYDGTNEITDKASVVIPKEHKYVGHYSLVSATCTREGRQEYYECLSCNKYFTDENCTVEITDKESVIIQKLPHDLTKYDYVAATCDTDGMEEYYQCETCHSYFSDVEAENETYYSDVIISSPGHNMTKLNSYIAPTCTEEGRLTCYYCDRCENYFEDEYGRYKHNDLDYYVIDSLGHNYGYVRYKAPTCTEEGNEAYYECSRCEEWFEYDNIEVQITDKSSLAIPANGHSYPDTREYNTAQHWYECTVCKNQKDVDTHDLTEENCTTCGAENYSEGLKFTKNTDYYSVSIGTATDAAIIIPSQYKGLSVTVIDNNAFKDCAFITSVQIPASVISIGNSAFSNCSGLEKVNIKDIAVWCEISFGSALSNPLSYAKNLYLNNKLITELEIPDSITSIVRYAFYGCSSITSVVIGNNVTSIGQSAFQNCSGLTSITLPFVGATLNGTTLTNFGYIFGASSSSYNSDYVPESLKTVVINGGSSINGWAFYKCSGFESVTIGNGVTSIEGSAFRECSSLNNLTIGNDVSTIGMYAFRDCNSLANVTIGNGVTSIENYAFDGCSGLEKVNITDIVAWCAISFGNDCSNPLYYAHNLYLNGELTTELEVPDGATSIGMYTFRDCSSLTSVTISNSVTYIAPGAFQNCSALTSITLPFVGNGVDKQHFGCIFGASDYNKNSAFVPESLKTVVITGGYIYMSAFYGCSKLTSITIPDDLSSIGSYAFSGCSSLKGITIPNSVTSIGNNAFEYCRGFTSIPTLPDGITSIGYEWFKDCSGIISLTIPDRITTIDNNAFSNCSGLTSVTIGNNVTTIKYRAFYNCRQLTSITIPANVITIGGGVFENCSSLTSITLPFTGNGTDNTHLGYIFGASKPSNNPDYVPESLKTVVITGGSSIGESAFYQCSALTSITIPNSVTTIGNYAFQYCSGLASIIIPDSVTSIGHHAFSYSGLTSITIPNTVTELGAAAFSRCSELTSVIIGNGVTSIEANTFDYCSELTSVTIGSGVTTIGDYAFQESGSLTSIIIPDNVTSIGQSTFFNCSGLTSVTIGNSVTKIGNRAFSTCSSLETVYWNATACTSAGAYGSEIFKNCSKFTTVIIGQNVTKIPNSAFGGGVQLKKVYYSGTAEEWDAIEIGTFNTSLTNAKRYYYSKEEPTAIGNYWHYVDGEVAEW
ncbi:MAG: leucine-rich repeat domain-containing protein [Clostridia bacterium]|nr:leucine-rich repeat domain-containing protein [Clostridia bacterium]